jgi:hypothetical protein
MYDIRDVAIPWETVWNRSSKDKTGEGQQHDDNDRSFWSIIMARKIVRKEGVTMGLSFALGVASKSLATVVCLILLCQRSSFQSFFSRTTSG